MYSRISGSKNYVTMNYSENRPDSIPKIWLYNVHVGVHDENKAQTLLTASSLDGIISPAAKDKSSDGGIELYIGNNPPQLANGAAYWSQEELLGIGVYDGDGITSIEIYEVDPANGMRLRELEFLDISDRVNKNEPRGRFILVGFDNSGIGNAQAIEINVIDPHNSYTAYGEVIQQLEKNLNMCENSQF